MQKTRVARNKDTGKVKGKYKDRKAEEKHNMEER